MANNMHEHIGNFRKGWKVEEKNEDEMLPKKAVIVLIACDRLSRLDRAEEKNGEIEYRITNLSYKEKKRRVGWGQVANSLMYMKLEFQKEKRKE